MQKQSNAQPWIDITNLILGAILFLAPWIVGPAGAGGAWNAWIVGALVVVIAAGALTTFAPWEEWSNLALGAWAAISPWLFGFQANAGATWTHVIVGGVVFALAGVQLWFVSGTRPGVMA